jgi:hypothetical protein
VNEGHCLTAAEFREVIRDEGLLTAAEFREVMREEGLLTAAEFREVMREQGLRFERAMKALSADIRRDVKLHREESRRYFERLDAKLEDQLAESRAGREALFRILDRLDNGGTAPAG